MSKFTSFAFILTAALTVLWVSSSAEARHRKGEAHTTAASSVSGSKHHQRKSSWSGLREARAWLRLFSDMRRADSRTQHYASSEPRTSSGGSSRLFNWHKSEQLAAAEPRSSFGWFSRLFNRHQPEQLAAVEPGSSSGWFSRLFNRQKPEQLAAAATAPTSTALTCLQFSINQQSLQMCGTPREVELIAESSDQQEKSPDLTWTSSSPIACTPPWQSQSGKCIRYSAGGKNFEMCGNPCVISASVSGAHQP